MGRNRRLCEHPYFARVVTGGIPTYKHRRFVSKNGFTHINQLESGFPITPPDLFTVRDGGLFAAVPTGLTVKAKGDG
jgi:hypothetical protein